MAIRINLLNGRTATAPIRPLPEEHLYAECLAGRMPAEVLRTSFRQGVLAELHRLGWTDREIAIHTRMTLYTTARIRTDLGLAPNTRPADGAVA